MHLAAERHGQPVAGAEHPTRPSPAEPPLPAASPGSRRNYPVVTWWTTWECLTRG